MGEILGGVFVLLAVILILIGIGVAFTRINNANKADSETPTYRNHLAMARWIEHALDDDMERACIPEQRQDAARKLLAAFYKEES